jgi:mannitol/fructose-specific phosphotransferase system IIA component
MEETTSTIEIDESSLKPVGKDKIGIAKGATSGLIGLGLVTDGIIDCIQNRDEKTSTNFGSYLEIGAGVGFLARGISKIVCGFNN